MLVIEIYGFYVVPVLLCSKIAKIKANVSSIFKERKENKYAKKFLYAILIFKE